MAAAARAPAELEVEDGLEAIAVRIDRVRGDLGRDAFDQPPVANDIDVIDEAAGDGFDAQDLVRSLCHAAAERQPVDAGEQVRAISSQRHRAAGVQRVPDRGAGIFSSVDRAAAVAIGTGIGAVVIGVAEEAEDIAVSEAMFHRGMAVGRPHRVQERSVPERGFGQAVHGDDFEHWRQVFVEAAPVDAARALAIADVVGEGEGATGVARFETPVQLGRALRLDQLVLVEIAIDDGIVAVLA